MSQRRPARELGKVGEAAPRTGEAAARANGEGAPALPAESSLRGQGLARPSELAGEPTPLRALLEILRRRRWLVILSTLLVPAAALAFSLTTPEKYSAEASLLFRDSGVDQQLFGTSFFPESSDPTREAATNLRLVSLGAVADRTAAALPQLGLNGQQVSEKIDVSQEGEADLATVTATDEVAARAATLANTFATEFIEFRREADRSTIRNAQRLVQTQLDRLTPEERLGTQGERVRDRAEELEILASLQTGKAELVERAKAPTAPASPKPKQNVAFGVLIGLLLGVGLALLREQVDRRLRDSDDVQAAYGLPVLGEVPHTVAMAGDRALLLHQLPATATEAFRLLRANLRYFNVDRQVKSVLTTSAAPRDGKTTVSWNLAVAEAQAGKSVLVIEADLRRPTLAHTHEITPHGGLSLVLAGVQELDDAIMGMAGVSSSPEGSPLKLDVLYAGPPPPNPAELIESQRMAELLREAQARYDFVVVDTPPTSIVADAIPLMRQVSGVIVVARVGQSLRDAADALREQLEQLDAPALGVVVNGVRATGSYYYRS